MLLEQKDMEFKNVLKEKKNINFYDNITQIKKFHLETFLWEQMHHFFGRIKIDR